MTQHAHVHVSRRSFKDLISVNQSQLIQRYWWGEAGEASAVDAHTFSYYYPFFFLGIVIKSTRKNS